MITITDKNMEILNTFNYYFRSSAHSGRGQGTSMRAVILESTSTCDKLIYFKSTWEDWSQLNKALQ